MVWTPTHAPHPAAPPRRRRRRGLLGRLARLVVLLVGAVAVLLGAGWAVTPSVDDAASRVAAHLAEHSAPALEGGVPAKVAEALVATEDSRYRSSPGLDPVALVKLPLALARGEDPGGATLEQQLAKNLYSGGSQDLAAKAEDAVLALKLDHAYSKDEILRMYLDDGYYGHGHYGLTAAAEGYFGVAPADLTWAQASLLAGLFQAPSDYDPVVHPAAARARQAHVLDRLVSVGTLSRAQADRVADEPWGLRTA